MSDTDLQLLARYAGSQSEDAFAELVRRHLDLVHSAALRQVRSPQLAEEVAQAVFTDLSLNAGKLKPGTILAAWLYEVTRRKAIDVVRRESRRQARERLAVEMAAMNTEADWSHIEPLLDEAMHALDDTDRTAVLLRYFENKSLREVGQTLGTTDDAAQKRVSRAVERLREFFVKRGVTVGVSGLVLVVSANAVQAAPVMLVNTIVPVALAQGVAASGSAPGLMSGLWAWAKSTLSTFFGPMLVGVAGITMRELTFWESMGFCFGLLLCLVLPLMMSFRPPSDDVARKSCMRIIWIGQAILSVTGLAVLFSKSAAAGLFGLGYTAYLCCVVWLHRTLHKTVNDAETEAVNWK